MADLISSLNRVGGAATTPQLNEPKAVGIELSLGSFAPEVQVPTVPQASMSGVDFVTPKQDLPTLQASAQETGGKGQAHGIRTSPRIIQVKELLTPGSNIEVTNLYYALTPKEYAEA
jgi:hypothetical protein